jgi:intracellular proteinase inhibitor BsuPI
MIRLALIFSILLAAAAGLPAQETTPEPSGTPETTPSAAAPLVTTTPVGTATPITTTTLQKRGLFGRILHPFSSSQVLPKYNDRKLRGLILDLQVSPQPVRLSEVRQIQIKVTVTNLGNHMIPLDFPTDQRIEIQLLNSGDAVLTKWSENHAIKDKPGTILINPGEHVEYKENIATRDLTPGRVFTADVFFPKYPELHVRQKFLTEP